jgi:hypothetical protein
MKEELRVEKSKRGYGERQGWDLMSLVRFKNGKSAWLRCNLFAFKTKSEAEDAKKRKQ